MKVVFTAVGQVERPPNLVLELSAIPREGDVVNWSSMEPLNRFVRTVVWVLDIDEEDETVEEPYVYIVIGPRRPE